MTFKPFFQPLLVVEENTMSPATDVDVLIVGAGFSGLHQLYLLRKQNLKVRVVEAESKIGGIWHYHNYPGFRVDTVTPLYSLKIDEVNKDWAWSEKFASKDELMSYMEHMDKVLKFSNDISFNTRVQSAEYNLSTNTWNIHTTTGEYNAKFFILCVGIGGITHVPKINGLDTFKGVWHHSSHWPREGLDHHGKRVAVIGTGATGVQLIQTIGPQVSHLTVFQRTPNLSLPMKQAPLDIDSQRNEAYLAKLNSALDGRVTDGTGFNTPFIQRNTMDDTPEVRRATFEEVWSHGGFNFWVAGYKDLFFNKEANNAAYDFWAEKTRARITDPKKKDLLAPLKPPHAFGTKRPSLEMNYYEVLDQSNVDIVDTKTSPIDHVTATSIVTSDGVEHGPYDIIVLATGYDIITGNIGSIAIKGKDGELLKEKWDNGIKTYLGLTSAGFPNLFFVYGPQCPTAYVNGIPLLSAQSQWVAECIAYLRENGKDKIEASQEAQEKWSEISKETVYKSLMMETESWYLGSNIPGKKREPLCYLGGLQNYLNICKGVASKNYEGFVIA